MAEDRTVYHVVPDTGARKWIVSKENDDAFREEFPTKKEAVAAARTRARGQEPSQLKVHDSRGNMDYEHTYGRDPRRSPS